MSKYKLGSYTHTWDKAALETLGTEFLIDELLNAQSISLANGASVLDDFIFDSNRIVELPVVESTVNYFKAPWDED